MKRSRLLLLIVGMILLVGAVAYLFVWNKPHRDVASEKGIDISADAIVAEYNADEKAADAKYLNKPIQVKGSIAKVEKNQDGQTTVLFASADPMSSVFCTMRDKEVSLDSGATATVKGICSGHTMDVLLTDCVLVK
jgi:hypothetical protein